MHQKIFPHRKPFVNLGKTKMLVFHTCKSVEDNGDYMYEQQGKGSLIACLLGGAVQLLSSLLLLLPQFLLCYQFVVYHRVTFSHWVM
eukprot:c15084_g1_i2 orf=109-369(+)